LPGKDFAVLSFDDNPELYAYNLNTVAPPREKIGYYLKEMLNRKKDIFKKEAKQTIRLTSTILERNTV
jgi:DNA-binding LacI/PurR family transcriptional regulator